MINLLRHNVRQVAVSKKPAPGPLIGYARVSTQGQDLAQQRATLRGVGCSRVFEEKVSGAKRDRPQLERLLDHLRVGDVVAVTRLDRLARSTRDLLEIAERIKDAGAGLRSIAEPWADTTTPAGRMILTVFAGIADDAESAVMQSDPTGIQESQGLRRHSAPQNPPAPERALSEGGATVVAGGGVDRSHCCVPVNLIFRSSISAPLV